MKNLYRYIQLMAAAFLIITIPDLLQAAPGSKEMDKSAEIISIKGSSEFKADKTASWKLARVQQNLFDGNYVRTGTYSRMGILFRDKTQIRMNQKTILRIKAVQDPGASSGKTILNLKRGRVWSQTKTLTRELIMETPSATAAIRGTDWDIEVDEKGTSTITVLSGEVEYYNSYGRVTVRKNEQARAIIGKAPVKLVIVLARDRVQWVTAYAVEPLRHIYFYSSEMASLQQELVKISGKSANDLAKKGYIYADMGQWQQAEANFKAALAAGARNSRALVGMGYVAMRKGATREAERYFARVKAGRIQKELAALGQISSHIQQGRFARAISQLQKMILARNLRQPAAYLMLSDIMIYTGELPRAIKHARQALRKFPNSARAHSQLAKLLLLTGNEIESERYIEQALSSDKNSYEAKVVQGDVARIQGDANAALKAYQEATQIKSGHDAAWYGLGVVNTEREYVEDARSQLGKALSINPAGPGYQGEKGTLETFANNFKTAEAAFTKALADNPSDYVALTGLGIMQLKRGKTDDALEKFLRAGLMEPRYARARMYTGVSYYQLGYVNQALEELRYASELDDKDPMPYLFSSIIYTDLLRPADAIDAARKAFVLMPNLKSLNQLANTQRGTSNLGQAFAFMGMEDWAQMYAQESYYPFWAGSHLFLADRYNGLFTKNSELFQGFIADPTVFGASNRFQPLVEKPGHYASASFRSTTVKGSDNNVKGNSPFVEVNGFDNSISPFAYYVAYENFDLSFDSGPYETDTYTLALGLKPTHRFGMFLFADHSNLNTEIDEVFSGITFDTNEELISDRIDLGMHYKFTPTSQVALKIGQFRSDDDIDGFLSGEALDMTVDVELPEYALRHTFSIGGKHEVSWGYEYAYRETDLLYNKYDFILSTAVFFTDIYVIFDQDYSEKSSDFYISDRFTLSPEWLVQLDIYHQKYKRKAHEDFILDFPLIPPPVLVASDDSEFSDSQLSPRFGLVYKFDNSRLIRFTYQNWLRPSSFSSLGPVATAGIPLDDRFVSRGGELTRYRGQIDWEFSARTFSSAFLDYKDIDNNKFTIISPYSINDLEGLNKLKSRDLGSLARDDMLEFVNTPDYDGGKIKSAGISINYLLNRQWGLFGKYINTTSENTGDTFSGNDVPYLPTHVSALGATWTDPGGWYLASRVVYRTERYSDEANTNVLKASWDAAADLYWQSIDKHWLLRFSVDDAFEKNQGTQYTAEANFRF